MILGTEDHGSLLAFDPCFHNLKQVIGFLLYQRADEPFIKDEKIHFQVRSNGFPEFTGALSDIQFFQKLRKAYVTYFFKFSAGSIAKCTCNVRLAAAAGTTQDDMPPVIDILAGGEAWQLRLV